MCVCVCGAEGSHCGVCDGEGSHCGVCVPTTGGLTLWCVCGGEGSHCGVCVVGRAHTV